jgi:hypothetical protein
MTSKSFSKSDLEPAKTEHIGKSVYWAGREWKIVGIDYLGNYDLERFEERHDGRYRIGGNCRFGLPEEHGHYARLIG